MTPLCACGKREIWTQIDRAHTHTRGLDELATVCALAGTLAGCEPEAHTVVLQHPSAEAVAGRPMAHSLPLGGSGYPRVARRSLRRCRSQAKALSRVGVRPCCHAG
eukprot:scaffold8721_cov80-Phaeocystis_antarctica.AAC.37